MRVYHRMLCVTGVLLTSPSAWAADCLQGYSGQQILQDIETLQLSLRALDEANFTIAAMRVDAGIPCLTTLLPPGVFSTAFRYVGVHYYFRNDEPAARRWFRSSLELNPTYEWDATDLELGHPIRTMFEEERGEATVEPSPIEGKVLQEVAGASWFLDGRPLSEAAATAERYHVVQKVAKDRSVRTTWLAYGNDLPPAMLADAAAAAPIVTEEELAAAAKAAPVVTEDGKVVVERQRPREKTPLMIAGVVSVAGAGVAYTFALMTANKLDPARQDFPSTTTGLEAVQSRANLLALTAGGALALGAGLEVWAVLLDGNVAAGFVVGF